MDPTWELVRLPVEELVVGDVIVAPLLRPNTIIRITPAADVLGVGIFACAWYPSVLGPGHTDGGISLVHGSRIEVYRPPGTVTPPVSTLLSDPAFDPCHIPEGAVASRVVHPGPRTTICAAERSVLVQCGEFGSHAVVMFDGIRRTGRYYCYRHGREVVAGYGEVPGEGAYLVEVEFGTQMKVRGSA